MPTKTSMEILKRLAKEGGRFRFAAAQAATAAAGAAALLAFGASLAMATPIDKSASIEILPSSSAFHDSLKTEAGIFAATGHRVISMEAPDSTVAAARQGDEKELEAHVARNIRAALGENANMAKPQNVSALSSYIRNGGAAMATETIDGGGTVCVMHVSEGQSAREQIAQIAKIEPKSIERVEGTDAQWRSMVVLHEVAGHCRDAIEGRADDPTVATEARADAMAERLYRLNAQDDPDGLVITARRHARAIGGIHDVIINAAAPAMEATDHALSMMIIDPTITPEDNAKAYDVAGKAMAERAKKDGGEISLTNLHKAARAILSEGSIKNPLARKATLLYAEGAEHLAPSLTKTLDMEKSNVR